MLSPSALLMIIPSAISIIPRLMPCSSSPVPASWINRKKSTIEWTAVSLCPTPTVSTKIVSKPAASHKTMVSRVFRATPPNEPADGEGRMKAFFSRESASIRVLSPRMLPFERSLLGSIARTANLWPALIRCMPNESIEVLLPAPGTPVMPTRTDLPACGRHFSIISCAISWCSCNELSTKVTAWLKMVMFPSRMPATYSSAVYRFLCTLFFR